MGAERAGYSAEALSRQLIPRLALNIHLPKTVGDMDAVTALALGQFAMRLVGRLLSTSETESILAMGRTFGPLETIGFHPLRSSRLIQVRRLSTVVLKVLISSTTPAVGACCQGSPVLLIEGHVSFPDREIRAMLFDRSRRHRRLLVNQNASVSLLRYNHLRDFVRLSNIRTGPTYSANCGEFIVERNISPVRR